MVDKNIDEDTNGENLENLNYLNISIEEGSISGYTGFSEDFKFKMNDGDTIIQFKLELKWQVNPDSYQNMSLDNCTILQKISGTLLYLGNYYWTFLRNFYRTMAVSTDVNLRMIGMLLLMKYFFF